MLCTIEANRTKGNRAPEDAWSGEALREIVERAERGREIFARELPRKGLGGAFVVILKSKETVLERSERVRVVNESRA